MRLLLVLFICFSSHVLLSRGYNWTQYHSFDDISKWVVEMATNNPNIAELFDAGYSTEKRRMQVLRVGKNSASRIKPAIFIDAGIHAREWIAISTGTYFINELLTNTDQYSKILNELDIYFLPVVNPDGYEFSRDDSDPNNRLWRKTRSVQANSSCLGVDGNRNYGFHWGEEGTSDDPCDFYFQGAFPFSEPETANLRDFIQGQWENGVNWTLYVTLHTKTQQILAPWGYTHEKPNNYEQHLIIGMAGAAAIEAVHGNLFEVTSSSENALLSGNSRDWAKGCGIFQYSYTFELRNTTYGFVVPEELIQPMAEESWAGMVAMLQFFMPNSEI